MLVGVHCQSTHFHVSLFLEEPYRTSIITLPVILPICQDKDTIKHYKLILNQHLWFIFSFKLQYSVKTVRGLPFPNEATIYYFLCAIKLQLSTMLNDYQHGKTLKLKKLDTKHTSADFGVNATWIYALNLSFNNYGTISPLLNLSHLQCGVIISAS